MGDLKPCPFCGSDLVGHWAPNSCIVCHHCGAEGPVLDGHALSHLSSGSAWNTRSTPSDVAALVEVLRLLSSARPRIDISADDFLAEFIRPTARAAVAKWEAAQ